MRETLEHFDEVSLGLKALRAAVCQQGVKEGVVRSGFEAAEEHPVLHAEFGGANDILNSVGVDFQDSLAETAEDLMPLVEGVLECSPDVAGWAMSR